MASRDELYRDVDKDGNYILLESWPDQPHLASISPSHSQKISWPGSLTSSEMPCRRR